MSCFHPWSTCPSTAPRSTATSANRIVDNVQRFAVAWRVILDPGRGHGEQEHRQAVASGRGGIGAGDGAAPVGLVGAGHEDLLAGEHEPVAVELPSPVS